MQLPERFAEKMKELLKEDYPAYRDSLLLLPETGMRVNTLKLGIRDFENLLHEHGMEIPERIPWTEDGYFVPEGLFSRLPWHQTGLYYIQEPAAMAPAAFLPVAEGDCVLDLCAAPGGKSLQLAARCGESGFLLSNDISASRAAILRKNLTMAGVTRAVVTCESPDKLASRLRGRFDAVLVDAPCSGEGMFRRDPQMLKTYAERGPESYLDVQRDILEAAAGLVAPGGHLLYSTCTFSPCEDEEQVLSFLERHEDFHPVMLPDYEGFVRGYGLPEAVRLYPHKIRGEGQFAALLERDGEAVQAEPAAPAGQTDRSGLERRTGKADQTGIAGRAEKAGKAHRGASIPLTVNGLHYAAPAEAAGLGSLRCLMTGVFIGEEKKGLIRPSQAMAQALRAGEWPQELYLSSSDPRAARYLRGETLSLSEGEIRKNKDVFISRLCGEGVKSHLSQKEVLVLIDGFPVGFGMENGPSLKNRREKGWCTNC